MKRLDGRVAVVTGAASGIGRATAIALADKGCTLALADVQDEAMREVAEALGGKTSCHVVDVADRARMEAFVDEVIEAHGAVHVVVNNAGVAIGATFEEHSLEDLEWIIGINLWGVIYGCKLFLPHLKAVDEAHIVNISSVAGILPCPNLSSYCITKFGVRGLSETLRLELAPYGIGVTSVHPGMINTNIPKAARYLNPDLDAVKDAGAALFDRVGHSPEYAARRIVRGIERNSQRVLIGPEAYVIDGLKRGTPGAADRLFGWLGDRAQGLAARGR